jgi:putative multiple sugar transport system permease protein
VQIIKGLVLLLAVGIDVYSKKQGRPSILGRFSRTREEPVTFDRPDIAPSNSPEATARPKSTTPN